MIIGTRFTIKVRNHFANFAILCDQLEKYGVRRLDAAFQSVDIERIEELMSGAK